MFCCFLTIFDILKYASLTSFCNFSCLFGLIVFLLFFEMRDYNALFDWLEKFRLTVYIDNFVKGGFDMTSVLGITAEVKKATWVL